MENTLEEKTLEEKNKDFTEEVISETIKEVNLYGFRRLFIDLSKYKCKNCGEQKLAREYVEKVVKRIPNPEIFSNNAQPSIHTIKDEPRKYFCRNCKVESKDLNDILDYIRYVD